MSSKDYWARMGSGNVTTLPETKNPCALAKVSRLNTVRKQQATKRIDLKWITKGWIIDKLGVGEAF